MESLLYNINPKVYKANANAAICFSRFNPRINLKFTYVAALNRENKGNTRIVKINNRISAIKACRASNNYKKVESVTFIDFREKKIIESADKVSRLMFRGSGC